MGHLFFYALRLYFFRTVWTVLGFFYGGRCVSGKSSIDVKAR